MDPYELDAIQDSEFSVYMDSDEDGIGVEELAMIAGLDISDYIRDHNE